MHGMHNAALQAWACHWAVLLNTYITHAVYDLNNKAKNQDNWRISFLS